MTRAVSGFTGLAIHRAMSSRVIPSLLLLASSSGTPGETTFSFDKRLPRAKTRVSRAGRSIMIGTMVPAIALCRWPISSWDFHAVRRSGSWASVSHSGRVDTSMAKFRTGVAWLPAVSPFWVIEISNRAPAFGLTDFSGTKTTHRGPSSFGNPPTLPPGAGSRTSPRRSAKTSFIATGVTAPAGSMSFT